MAYRLFQFGATGRGIYVDENGSLIISNDPNASGYIVGYGDEGHPLLVDASGRLLVQNDSPTTSLAALSDTDTVGAVSGQFLMYDSASTDWIPSDVTLAVEDLSNAVISTFPPRHPAIMALMDISSPSAVKARPTLSLD